MSPREARAKLQSGEVVMEKSLPPEPPPEWREYRRVAMATAILSARRFLKGKSLEDIRRMARMGDVSNARVAFVVGRGVKFLFSRGYLKLK